MMLQRHHGMALVRELVPLLGFQAVANAWSAFILENASYLKWDLYNSRLYPSCQGQSEYFCKQHGVIVNNNCILLQQKPTCGHTQQEYISLCTNIYTYVCVSMHSHLHVTGCVHQSNFLPPPLPLLRLFPVIVPYSSDIWHKRELWVAWPLSALGRHSLSVPLINAVKGKLQLP